MSYIRLGYLYCDGGEMCPREDPGQQAPFVIDPLPHDTAETQRADARECGWIRRSGKDYCKSCAERLSLNSDR